MSDERQAHLESERKKDDQKTLEERLKAAEERAEKSESTNARLLEQSQDWKKKAQSASDKEDERLKEIQAEKEKELLAKGEFKKLLDQERERTTKLEGERDNAVKAKSETENTLLEARKLSAFENRLGGNLKNDKYLGFVDTTGIVVNPDTGEIDVSSVDNSVKGFLSEHKDLVNFSAGKMPNFQGGKGNPISAKQWTGMSHKDRLKNLSAAVESDSKARRK